MRGLLINLLFIMAIGQSWAQPFRHSLRNYTAVDGLPQSQIMSMVEDRHGYLWVGTQGGGLARYDGREFTVYTTKDGLLSNEVIGLLIDRRQNLWILHPKGLSKFDGRNFKKIVDTKPLIPSKRFRRIYQSADSIYMLNWEGRITKVFRDSALAIEKPFIEDRLVWRMNDEEGVLCFLLDDDSFLVKTPRKTFRVHADSTLGKVFNIFHYKKDILFRSEHGLYKLDYLHAKIEKLDWNTRFFVLQYDEKGNYFWTTNGVSLFKETIQQPANVLDTVLQDVEVTDVMNDSEGNIWFASNGRGLYKYFIQDFDRCSSENLRGVMAIMEDRSGARWIGTMSKGLWRIKQGKISSYIDKKENYRNSIHAIRQDREGTMWIGTGAGVGRYDNDKDAFQYFTREDGLPGFSVTTIDFDESDRLWIGTGNGLSYFDRKTFKNYSTKDGLLVNAVLALFYSKRYHKLFIGNEAGLQSFSNNKFDQIGIDGIENAQVISINPFRDSLIVGSTGGAGFFVIHPGNKKMCKVLTTRDGLASDFIYFAAPDEDDNLWVGSEKGISRVKLNKDLNIVENLHFDYDNGLTGVETNQNAFYLSPKEKYFGLIDGLYEFNNLGGMDKRSFDLHLTDLEILYGEYPSRIYADSLYGFFKIPYKPQFPPDKNHLTFKFNRVDKRYPKSVKFKYFLENFDKTWSQPSSNNQVTYSNLPPGKYVFRVMATNSKGSWSDAKIEYEFIIKTPFYKTASFLMGAVILSAGLITLILYLRVKQRINRVMMLERIRTKEQETLRKEIARDFHDEMGNQLTRIINYVSLLKLNGNGHSNGSNGTNDLYTKVEDSAKYLYTGTRDFIWSIDPGNDELSKLFIHIRDFGEKLFEEKNINFRAFNEIREKIKLPYGFSREANLIFKEAMTNAFKYSLAKNTTLILKRTPDGYEMSFEDDGVGFYTSDIEKLSGLQNIRERADRINGVLRIHSERNFGTKIILNFKLTKTLKYGLAL
jgi:ligand-binding sensor domain-containing protein/signal transduction histidine kinase